VSTFLQSGVWRILDFSNIFESLFEVLKIAMTIVTYHLEVENLFEVLKITEDVHYLPLFLPGPVACGVCVFFVRFICSWVVVFASSYLVGGLFAVSLWTL
jgi:hypothetical protein